MDNFSIVSAQFMITHVCYILLMVVIYAIYTFMGNAAVYLIYLWYIYGRCRYLRP